MEILLAVLLLTVLSEVNSSCTTKCSRVVCYYVNEAFISMRSDKIPPDLCTHIVISPFFVSKNHDLKTTFTRKRTFASTDLIDQKRKGNLKTLIAIQNDETFDVFVKMYTSESSRKKFIVKLKNLLRARDIDGVKIDEQLHPGGNRAEFANFIKDIADGFGKEFILSVGIPTNITFLEHYYDIASLSKHADMLDLASYHFTVPTITEDPQHHSPLKNKDKYSTQSIEYLAKYVLTKGADARKVNVGLSATQYQYISVNGGPLYLQEFESYDEYCIDSAYETGYDKTTALDPEGGFFTEKYYRDEEFNKYKEIAIFDDEKTLRTKVNFILYHNYGGVVVKALNYDDYLGNGCQGREGLRFPLIKEIKSACGL